MTVVHQRLMSVEEYLKFEETSELRHEYDNGNLYEIPGEKDINNRIAMALTAIFFFLLAKSGRNVYSQGIKVSIPNEKKYYYPDWLVTREAEIGSSVKSKPEILVEILSKASRTRDPIYKCRDYIKIPSLKYYLIIDPERTHITVHSKNESGEWEAEVYSEKTDIIPLPLLQTELPLIVVYP